MVTTVDQLKVGDKVTSLSFAVIRTYKTVKKLQTIRTGVVAVTLDRGYAWFCSLDTPVTIK